MLGLQQVNFLPLPLLLQAAVARQVLEYAGVPVGEGPEARVQVLAGLSGEVLPWLRQAAGLGPSAAAGFVFLDHCKPASGRGKGRGGGGCRRVPHAPAVGSARHGCWHLASLLSAHRSWRRPCTEQPARATNTARLLPTAAVPSALPGSLRLCLLQCYLPDLLAMERLGLVAPGTLLLADNVLVPGAPDYLQHVGASALGSSSGGADGGSSGGGSAGGSGGGAEGGLAYRTELRYTAFEVEERYKKDWQPRRDAMSVSRCL